MSGLHRKMLLVDSQERSLFNTLLTFAAVEPVGVVAVLGVAVMR